MEYKTMTKDALVAEIKRRRDSGRNINVDLRSTEDKLIAALQSDDMDSVQAVPEPVYKAVAASVPTGSLEDQLPAQPEMPSKATQPSDDVFASGFKAKHSGDGYTYQVAIVEGDLKPYKARIPKQASGHPGLYWEGTVEEFKEHFTKL